MQDQQKIEQEHYDDEISLIDLFLVLLRWKKLFIGVFFACLLAGIGYALISYTPSQNYHSTVEIGTYSNNWETEVLESPKELQSFLQEALLPSVRHKIAQQWEIESWKLPKVEIKIPDSPANLILLKSQISTSAPQDRQKQMEQLHDELIDSVKKRHNDKLNTYQTRLDATLEQKRLAIIAVQNNLKIGSLT